LSGNDFSCGGGDDNDVLPPIFFIGDSRTRMLFAVFSRMYEKGPKVYW
jgi:hypothetical protein